MRYPLLIAAAFALAACSSAPPHQGPGRSTEPDRLTRADIVEVARSFIGTPYRPGGATRGGVDCSGLVRTVFGQFDIELPRTSYEQSQAGFEVPPGDLKPADLVFFRTSLRMPVTHVGIYIGRGQFIHASTGARRVRIDHLADRYFRIRLVNARRIVVP